MSAFQYPLTFPAHQAAAWRKIRRYAVPRWMIEEATACRLDGDWRGACAAANVDVDFDLADVARVYGTDTAGALENDLRHLAPDLVRWYLPRKLPAHTTLRAKRLVLLAGYGERPAGGPYLCVRTPPTGSGPERLTLTISAQDVHTDNWLFARYLWNARHADELRERCGGGIDRAPFHRADGKILQPNELPTADPGPGDPAGHAEWVITWHDHGHLERALEAAGILMDEELPADFEFDWADSFTLSRILAGTPLSLTALERQVREFAAMGFGDQFRVAEECGLDLLADIHPYIGFGDGLFHRAPIRSGVRIRQVSSDDLQREREAGREVQSIPDACSHRLPDLDLLRFGDITPGELHPLVSASLFPERVPQPGDGPPGPPPPSPATVECRGERHQVLFTGGRLRGPHSDDEVRRERALRAFGGEITGCFAVEDAWRTGTGWLPDELREQRDELFSRIEHGDAPGVLRMLEHGLDPHVRDSEQRTLLHLLHLLDHRKVLPALLKAGLDLEARDKRGRTPLYAAVIDGTQALINALLDAGARADFPTAPEDGST